MRAGRRSLAIAVAIPLATAAGAGAQTTLHTDSAPSKVATYGGVVAYSERDPGTGAYRLMYDTNADGRAEAVPVAPRAVPFDVDLGPGRDGRVIAVYSRCRREPQMDRRSGGPHPVWTTARGCDLWQYDFRAARESRVGGASTGQATEVLPTIWRDEIAFARVYHRRAGARGVYPYIYVRSLTAGTASRRQPGGARGTTGVPGPASMDLVGRRLAFTWTYERAGGGVSEARLVTVDRSHLKLDGEGWRDSVLRYLSPTVGDGRVYYGEQRATRRPAGGGTRSLGSRLWRYRISTGELARADAPAQLYAGLYDRRAFLAVYGTTGAFLDARACGERGCVVQRPAENPRFRVVRVVHDAWVECGDVVYTPRTDHGAFDIRARRTTCAVARAVARDGEGAGRDYASRGFRCTGEVRDNGLRRTRTTCRDGERRVTFVRS